MTTSNRIRHLAALDKMLDAIEHDSQLHHRPIWQQPEMREQILDEYASLPRSAWLEILDNHDHPIWQLDQLDGILVLDIMERRELKARIKGIAANTTPVPF